MSPILPHQWIELLPEGDRTRKGTASSLEEREFLSALRSGPVRLVDAFRRLRWSDSDRFQAIAQRALARGWIEVSASPPVEAVPTVLQEPETGEDALSVLLRRHAAGEVVDPIPPAALDPIDDPVPAQLDPAPWERLPPAAQATEANADELWKAMGVGPPSLPPGGLAAEHSAALETRPDPSLDAWLREPPTDVVVQVPEYGLPDRTVLEPSSPFARLRADPPSLPPETWPSPASARLPDGPSERSARRLADREKMLSAARREAADRKAAQQRAQGFLQEQAAEQARLDAEQAEIRRHESVQSRAFDFQERAARARRIRDGLPPD